MLERERMFLAVAREQGERRCEPTARAFAHDADAPRIDAETCRGREHPRQRRVTILDRARKARFGREPIIDRDDEAVSGDRERAVNRCER